MPGRRCLLGVHVDHRHMAVAVPLLADKAPASLQGRQEGGDGSAKCRSKVFVELVEKLCRNIVDLGVIYAPESPDVVDCRGTEGDRMVHGRFEDVICHRDGCCYRLMLAISEPGR